MANALPGSIIHTETPLCGHQESILNKNRRAQERQKSGTVCTLSTLTVHSVLLKGRCEFKNGVAAWEVMTGRSA